jgi:hypothetical protein
VISRRHLLQIAAAAAMLTSIVHARIAVRELFVFDGRFVAARQAARAHSSAVDCARDAARAWYRDIAAVLQPDMALLGVTSAVDLLILADLARGTGRKPHTQWVLPSGLIAWRLA